MQHLLLELGFPCDDAPPTVRPQATFRVELLSKPFYGARHEVVCIDARDHRAEPDDVPTLRSPRAPDSGWRLTAAAEDAPPRPKPARSSMVVPSHAKPAKKRRARRRTAA
ncbi:MAG: hypothetical protein KC657_20860 [Myxococcales bacterium]|nr:hypothetical protein [Myxococcales bacterium]